MRLSEAIRLGAMLKPQAFGCLFDGVGTCAMGAAEDAIGRPLVEADVIAEWDPIMDALADVPCPVCGHIEDDAVNKNNAVAHLNDDHRWTREAIADWVATIEAQHEQSAPVEQPVAVTA